MVLEAAGKRNRRITIERASSAQASPSGEERPDWSAPARTIVWANVTPLAGAELFRAQQLGAKVDTRFRILWIEGITPDEKLRIAFDGRLYDIRNVLELGVRYELEILAEAEAQ